MKDKTWQLYQILNVHENFHLYSSQYTLINWIVHGTIYKEDVYTNFVTLPSTDSCDSVEQTKR